MGFLAADLKGISERRRMRGATLPWDELEAEATRQGCSPADIFFDRAGRGDPDVVDTSGHEPARRVWRGHDPLPAPRTS